MSQSTHAHNMKYIAAKKVTNANWRKSINGKQLTNVLSVRSPLPPVERERHSRSLNGEERIKL